MYFPSIYFKITLNHPESLARTAWALRMCFFPDVVELYVLIYVIYEVWGTALR